MRGARALDFQSPRPARWRLDGAREGPRGRNMLLAASLRRLMCREPLDVVLSQTAVRFRLRTCG